MDLFVAGISNGTLLTILIVLGILCAVVFLLGVRR
jgi:hypothetical protein